MSTPPHSAGPNAADADPDRPGLRPNGGGHESDLAVLLGELNRVRSASAAGDAEPTPGEAMALATSAMRLVEAHLAESEGAEPGAMSTTTARQVLLGALDMLHAAVDRLEAEGSDRSATGKLFRRRRARGHTTTGSTGG